MYHFDISCGESPDFAMVNLAPLESYVGFPCGVNESEAPCVKSMLTALPSAVSGGQLPISSCQKFLYPGFYVLWTYHW